MSDLAFRAPDDLVAAIAARVAALLAEREGECESASPFLTVLEPPSSCAASPSASTIWSRRAG